MFELINMPDHKVTTEQVANDCPDMLRRWGRRHQPHLEKAHKCEEKVDQHYTSISRYTGEGGLRRGRVRCVP